MLLRLRANWLRILTHVVALTPLAQLIWDAAHDNLTVNPIQEATFRTGRYALIMLILSLACTPANTVLGFRQALRSRRTLGLYAFMYASLHFLIFTGVDYGFDWELLQEAIFEKRYALVGFAAFMILIPLAITSTKGWMRRLGRYWKRLHQLVYLAALLVIVHFVWLVKADIRRPLTYGAVVVLLLILRIPHLRRALSHLRYRLRERLKGFTDRKGVSVEVPAPQRTAPEPAPKRAPPTA